MQQVGDDFLAGAARASDDDVAVAAADDFDEVEDRAHARALTNDNLID